MGISFESRLGLQHFTEPTPFDAGVSVIPSSGLYAILAEDVRCTPRPFQVLYFGQTGDFRKRLTQNHEHYADWKRHTARLFVALRFTAGLTEQQRCELEEALIVHYNPRCNTVGRSSRNLPAISAPVFSPALPLHDWPLPSLPSLDGIASLIATPAPPPVMTLATPPDYCSSFGIAPPPVPVSPVDHFGAFAIAPPPVVAPAPIDPPRYRAARGALGIRRASPPTT